MYAVIDFDLYIMVLTTMVLELNITQFSLYFRASIVAHLLISLSSTKQASIYERNLSGTW
jgi:hypothetical protein